MPIIVERRYAARILPAIRVLAVAVPLLVAGCGGNSAATTLDVPNRVAIADLSNNGLNDVVVVSAQIDETGQTQNNPGFAAVILQDPSSHGAFEPTVHYETNGSPSGLALADLTGAGTDDIIVADYSNSTVSVLMHDPNNPGSFLSAVNFPAGGSPIDVAVADVNGDGKPDIVIADGATPGHMIVLLQDPANPGKFLAPVISDPLPTRAIRVAVGDLNGDGVPDVVITSFDTDGNGGLVSIFFNTKATPGTFQPRVDIATNAQSTSPGEPSGIVIADLNGDGLPDIAIAAQGPGTDGLGTTGAAVFLQDASNPGTFLTPVTYTADLESLSIAVGDVNGDGLPDLVLASQYPSGEGEVSILLQVAGSPGTFELPTYLTGAGHTVSVALGDLNDDGLLDIATADGTGAVVYFQDAASPGTFGTGTQVGG